MRKKNKLNFLLHLYIKFALKNLVGRGNPLITPPKE